MIDKLIEHYPQLCEREIKDRFFKHADLIRLIERLPGSFRVTTAGHSKEGRAVKLITCGTGSKKVFLWSQMHGDEPTGTMAIFDMLNFLSANMEPGVTQQLLKSCTLYFLPMVNPDGAARFTRRNAQQIDINRDYLQKTSPEARLLIDVVDQLKPDYGFNLHDQSTLWSVKGTGNPAVLSFLAPACTQDLQVTAGRVSAMKVIAEIFLQLDNFLPEQIGLFDDAFEPRAFGDNCQLNGMATILIEAGGLKGDPEKQEIRKYYFLSILSGLLSIARDTCKNQDIADYARIPKNSKEIFHILLRNVTVGEIQTSIGINFTEVPLPGGSGCVRTYTIEDVGDLSSWSAYQLYSGSDLKTVGEICHNELANFDLLENEQIILSFKNGKLLAKQ